MGQGQPGQLEREGQSNRANQSILPQLQAWCSPHSPETAHFTSEV